MSIETKWRKTLYWLRKNFPVQHPISVRRVPGKKLKKDECRGYCEFTGDKFRIRINRNMSFDLQEDILLHEWAHAMAWFAPDTKEDHPSEWGIVYARLYRTHIEWDRGKQEKKRKETLKYLKNQRLLFPIK